MSNYGSSNNSGSTKRVPAGRYQGRAVAGSEQYGETSNRNDQIVLELQLPEIGQNVSTFLVFSEKATPYSIRKLRACGWTGSDLSKLDGIDRNVVAVEVKYEMYNGEEKMKVDIQTGGSVVLESAHDDKKKRAFAAKHADFAKSIPVVTQTPSASAPARPRTGGGAQPLPPSEYGDASNDDIPF